MSGQISVAMHLPDGSAIGVDEDGVAYKGTPREVAPEALEVWTIPATDDEGGEAFHRITHVGDVILAWGTLTRAGFLNAAKREAVVGALAPELAEDETAVEAALEAAWQAELDTASHRDQPEFAYRVFDWQEV